MRDGRCLAPDYEGSSAMRQPTLLELVNAYAAAVRNGNKKRAAKLDKIIKKAYSSAPSNG